MSNINFSYIWPMALVVLSNVMYQICAKSVPADMNPFASLTVTYLIGAAFSAVLYYVLGANGSILKEYGKLNWAPFVDYQHKTDYFTARLRYSGRSTTPSGARIVPTLNLSNPVQVSVGNVYLRPLGVAVCLIGLVILSLK